MAEYVWSCWEHALALFRQQIVQEVGGVVLVGALVADEYASLEVALHFEAQVFDVVDEIVNGKRLLEYVGLVGAGRQARYGGQVAAVAAHGLHNEDAAVGADGGLLDLVAYGHDFIQCCVAAYWEVSAWYVVGDGGGHDYERYAEFFEIFASLAQFSHRGERLQVIKNIWINKFALQLPENLVFLVARFLIPK